MIEENLFKVGDLVEPSGRMTREFAVRKKTLDSMPWRVARISRDKRQIGFERVSKSGKKRIDYWWHGWFKTFVPEDSSEVKQ